MCWFFTYTQTHTHFFTFRPRHSLQRRAHFCGWWIGSIQGGNKRGAFKNADGTEPRWSPWATKKWTSVFSLCVVQLTSVIKQVTQKICIYIYNIYIYKHYVGLNGQAQLLKKSMCLLLSNMIACLLFFAYDLRCPNLNGTTKMWSVSPDQRPKIPPKKERNWNSSPFATIFFRGQGAVLFWGGYDCWIWKDSIQPSYHPWGHDLSENRTIHTQGWWV